jgi:GT2 family glycosyltransferase
MKLAVVILHYKHKEDTLECLKSVKQSDFGDFQIILVDNASGDEFDEETLRHLDIEIISSKENTGYSGGNNLGIKKALELGAEKIFVLNPDTTVKKDTISALVRALEKYDAGLVGPKIYFADSKKIWYAGGEFDVANVLGRHRGVDEEDKGQYDKDEETDGITGAAFMARAEVFGKIGVFDDRYFLYYEDADLSIRAKKAGFKIVYIPEAVVFHKNARSTGLGSPLQDYYITRNRMLFASKFLPVRTGLALFREAIRNIRNPMRRLALYDFIMGNFGKGSYK